MRGRLAAVAEGLDVYVVAPEDAVELWLALAELDRLVSGLRLVLTRKAAEAPVWRDEGFRSFEEWAATRSGGAHGDAVREARVADRLDLLPDTEEALRHGEITPRQAEQVIEAAAADPAAEHELLGQAKQGRPMRDLRKTANRFKAAASSRQDEQQRMRRWRQARDVRLWVAADGLAHLDAVGPLVELAAVKAAMDARADQLFSTARQLGEPADASHLRFDALVELATEQRDGRGTDPSAPHWTINLLTDLAAFQHGYVGRGQRCEIPGVGPVPVEAAQAVLGDAYLNLVITDGVDVRTVASTGRHVPKPLKRALYARDHGCVVCGTAFNLEHDHWRRPHHQRGLTCLSNLVTLCRRHHRMRHYDGWILDGGPGHWTFTPPGTNPRPGPARPARTSRNRPSSRPPGDHPDSDGVPPWTHGDDDLGIRPHDPRFFGDDDGGDGPPLDGMPPGDALRRRRSPPPDPIGSVAAGPGAHRAGLRASAARHPASRRRSPVGATASLFGPEPGDGLSGPEPGDELFGPDPDDGQGRRRPG